MASARLTKVAPVLSIFSIKIKRSFTDVERRLSFHTTKVSFLSRFSNKQSNSGCTQRPDEKMLFNNPRTAIGTQRDKLLCIILRY